MTPDLFASLELAPAAEPAPPAPDLPPEVARELGIDPAPAGVDMGEWVRWGVVLRRVCLGRPAFTTDDLWAESGRGPSRDQFAWQMLGLALRQAVRLGQCRPTDRTAEAGGVTLRVWESLTCQSQEG